MTSALLELIDAEAAVIAQREADAAAARQAQREASERECAQRFEAAARAVLGEVWDQLAPTFKSVSGNQVYFEFEAFGVRACLYGSAQQIAIQGHYWQLPRDQEQVGPALLHWLGCLRDNQRTEQAAQCGRAEQQAKEEAERAARRARAEADQARARAMMDTALAAAQAQLFRWPEGRVLALDWWRWQIGACPGSDTADGFVDYAEGWTANLRQVCFGVDGFVTLWCGGSERDVWLQPFHCPSVQRLYICSVAELPKELRVKRTVTVEGVYESWGQLELRANLGHTVPVGEEPVAWVQACLTSDPEAQ